MPPDYELRKYGPEDDPFLIRCKGNPRAKPTNCKPMCFQYG
jgi:hypothetical protein